MVLPSGALCELAVDDSIDCAALSLDPSDDAATSNTTVSAALLVIDRATCETMRRR
jgi:hypothetical protein